MNLVRDILDKPVVDRNGREMGRADSVVLQLHDGSAPTVAAIEIGPAVLAHRLRPGLGPIVRAVEEACGVADGRPVRIPVADILDVDTELTVDRAIGDTGAANVERAVRRLVWRR